MNITPTQEQKKSILITTTLFVLLLLALLFIKYAKATKIQELAGGGGGGISINFGDSDVGMGEDYTSEVLKVSDVKSQPAPVAPSEEDILTQDSDDAVGIPPTPKVNKATPVKVVTKAVPQKPKPAKSTNDALSNILGGTNKGGDGDDGIAGNKGKADGDRNSGGYYGDGGSGGGSGGGNGTGTGTGNGSGSGPGSGGGTGGGYDLGNRRVLTKPSPRYLCNETGKVVVQITVDQNGNTINAVAGIKGTTNTASCLKDQARIAAMNTKWQADPNAPAKQVGKIIYTFSLN